MNSRILSILLPLASAAIMPAATLDSLDLKSSGEISIATDSLGELRIFPEVEETSKGSWVGVGPKQKAVPNSGKSVEGEMVYGFPDGSEVTMTIKAKIEGQTVAVKAAWPTESTAKGFARLDLKIPGDEARDLTIEANGKPTVLDFGEARYLPKTNEIVFRRTSTGAFLFKLNGEILGTAIVTDRDHPDNGALLRLDTAKVGMDSNISDEKEAGWTLSFQE